METLHRMASQTKALFLIPEEGVIPKACVEYHLVDYKLVG